MRRPPSRPVALLAALIVTAMLAAASCSDDDAGIGLGAADRGDVVEIVDAPATVTARSAATLTAPADGTLASLNVQPGATVTAGQILAVVDSPSARDRLAQASAALAALSGGGGGGIGRSDLSNVQRRTDEAAAAAFKTARDAAMKIADLEIRAALLVQVQVAERAYAEAAATARALIGSVQRGLSSIGQAMSALTAAQRAQAQAAFDLAKSTVDALTLRAPVAGIVQLGGVSTAGAPSLADLVSGATGASGGALPAGGLSPPGQATGPGVDPSVAIGGRVSAGTAILTVVDVAELGLMAEVDETDVLLVEPGVTAGVELDAAPGARYAATVTSVDVLPSASARGGVSYRVRLKLGTGTFDGGRVAPTPRPGMNAVAHLEVRAIRDAVTVPAAAVFNVDGKDVVWTVREGKAVRVPVTIGVAGTDVVQIVSGVGDGDRIVVRGADRVRAGMELP